MSFGDIGSNLPLIIIAVAIIFFQFFLRRRPKLEKTPREIVLSLLSEVGRNLNQVESFHSSSRMSKFLVASWLRNKDRVDFLDQELQRTLSDAFMMAEDFNRQMAAAKTQQTSIYVATIEVDKLRGPLTRSKEGLEKWLVDNVGSKAPPVEYPTMMDMIFGSRPRR